MNGRILVAYSNSSTHVPTTADYLASIARYSDFDVHYVHATNGAELDFDLNEFDAVFQSYCVRLPFDDYVSPDYIAQMKSFRGVKLLAVQDEYEYTNKLKAAMQDIGYHVLLTNASKTLVGQLYPREQFSQTEFIAVLTGYVPEDLVRRGAMARPLRERSTMIGYRVRALEARFGRLGFEKFEIGRRMREICAARGIPHDIEWSDDKRVYGDAWYDFIGSCRATLGSETGSNVFDFDGSVKAAYDRLTADRNGPVPYEEFRAYTDPIEAQYDIGQISPRVFEAAAMRTPMILFSGRYLGLIEPDEHYIELKQDFSNVDAVLARLNDCDALEQMADRAYNHLVGSGKFSYRRFVKLIDKTILRKAKELGVPLRPARGRSHPAELGDVAALGSLRERPTAAPRDPIYFYSKHIARQTDALTEEIARLNACILDLNETYGPEVARLNACVLDLHEAYGAEVARLNACVLDLHEVYGAEIGRLNACISDFQAVYPAEIARLNEVHSAEIGHLKEVNEVYPAEITRLTANILDLDEANRAEVARLTEVYGAEIARLSADNTRLRRLLPMRVMLGFRKLGKSLFRFPGSGLSAAGARAKRFFW